MLEPVKSVLLLTLLTGLVCLLVPVLRKRMAATDLLQLLRQLLLLMAVSPILAFGLPELLPSEAANQLPRLIAPALKPLSLDWMLVASSGSPAGLQASQLPGLLLAVWVLVAAVLVFRLLRAVRVYQRIAMQAERLAPEALPVDLPAHVSVAVADDAPNAFAIGRRRPLIVIPARCIADRDDTILDAELAALLLHEAAHVQHGDTLWLPLCRLALCLWWPVIPMWFLYRELTLQAELAADAQALENANGPERRRYAAQLLRAMQESPVSINVGLPTFTSRPFRRARMRIQNIINSRTTSRQKSRPGLVAAATMLLSLPVMGMQVAVAGIDVSFIAPLLKGELTSTYGERKNPFTGKMAHHNGVDLKAPQGTPVLAPAAGEVIFAGMKNEKYGIVVEIAHLGGFRTFYAHLDSTSLKVGDAVSSGAEIGKVGNTGESTGPHLHVELFRDGERIDPMQFLPLQQD